MQCPHCRSHLATNLSFEKCPRCGRALAEPPAEVSSPSLNLDLGRDFYLPRNLWRGLYDVMELGFSPATAWEGWVQDDLPFLGRRSAPGYAALVTTTLGAMATALAMSLHGIRTGVDPYVVVRRWPTLAVPLVALAWVGLGFAVVGVVRRVVRAMLPASGDAKVDRMNASKVAVLAGAPALLSSGCAALWLVPELGPALALAASAYLLRATFSGLWRGPGMLLELDQAARVRLIPRLAIPLTAVLALAGAPGLLVLMAAWP